MTENEILYKIGKKRLAIKTIEEIINRQMKIALSDNSKEKIKRCRNYLEKRLNEKDEVIYGVNTGFGALYNQSISKEKISQLQENLILSHACGLGDEIPKEIAHLMLLLKVQNLSYGHSGVKIETVQLLIDFYNNAIIPVIYQQGSLGASGDLAPLAHLSLPLLGKGEVYYKDKKMPAAKALKACNLKPIELGAKEGLALLNGTQFMSAYGVSILIELEQLLPLSDLFAAITLEGFDGRIEPFNDLIQQVRAHKGQATTAKNIRRCVKDSEIIAQHKTHVQDPYSLRCVPQVHGATKDAALHIKKIFEIEINSVTDNPTIFPEEDLIISAGNFHGQPLAINLDYLAIAIAEMGSISERRTYKLLSGQRDLPAFLVADPGLNSGFMIPQYTAASIVSQNKQLCTPASVDTIDSSNGQEDHVSMGANAATKAYKVLKNWKSIMGIELLTAAQALEFRKPKKSSPFIEDIITRYRKEVPYVEKDVEMHLLMKKSIAFIDKIEINSDEAYSLK